jgi:hypothetical protein
MNLPLIFYPYPYPYLFPYLNLYLLIIGYSPVDIRVLANVVGNSIQPLNEMQRADLSV